MCPQLHGCATLLRARLQETAWIRQRTAGACGTQLRHAPLGEYLTMFRCTSAGRSRWCSHLHQQHGPVVIQQHLRPWLHGCCPVELMVRAHGGSLGACPRPVVRRLGDTFKGMRQPRAATGSGVSAVDVFTERLEVPLACKMGPPPPTFLMTTCSPQRGQKKAARRRLLALISRTGRRQSDIRSCA